MAAPDPNPIRFDKTVNLGHVISTLVFVGGIFLQWSVMDKRVTVLEESRQTQRERDTNQDTNTREKAQEVKDALADLRRSVEKLSDKLEAAK